MEKVRRQSRSLRHLPLRNCSPIEAMVVRLGRTDHADACDQHDRPEVWPFDSGGALRRFTATEMAVPLRMRKTDHQGWQPFAQRDRQELWLCDPRFDFRGPDNPWDDRTSAREHSSWHAGTVPQSQQQGFSALRRTWNSRLLAMAGWGIRISQSSTPN